MASMLVPAWYDAMSCNDGSEEQDAVGRYHRGIGESTYWRRPPPVLVTPRARPSTPTTPGAPDP